MKERGNGTAGSPVLRVKTQAFLALGCVVFLFVNVNGLFICLIIDGGGSVVGILK